jgi:hypothetical protein
MTTNIMGDEPQSILEICNEVVKQLQSEGMWAAMQGEPPEFPDSPEYMMGYKSVSK